MNREMHDGIGDTSKPGSILSISFFRLDLESEIGKGFGSRVSKNHYLNYIKKITPLWTL